MKNGHKKNGHKKSSTPRKPHAKDPLTLEARRKDARAMLAAGKSTIAVRKALKEKYGMALGQHALLSMRSELKPFLIGGSYDRRADGSWKDVQSLQADANRIVANEERGARVSVPVTAASAVFTGSSISVPASTRLAEELVAARAPFTFDGVSIKVQVDMGSVK